MATPASFAFTGTGAANAQTLTFTQAGNTDENFSIADSNALVVTIAEVGSNPEAYTITPVGAGSATLTVTGIDGKTATVPVTVTLAANTAARRSR